MPPRSRQLKSVPDPVPRAVPDLRDAVETALAGMSWAKDSDRGLADLARRYAHEIETAHERADELAELYAEARGDMSTIKRLQKLEAMCEATKVVGWLGPQLQGVLRDLGGTPAARAAMKEEAPIGGRLEQLRAAAKGKHGSSAVGAAEGDGP